MLKRAVITGIGAVTPLGNNAADFWTNLVAGMSGAARITRFDPSHHKTQFACEVKNFDPVPILEKNEARKLDLFVQFAMVAAEECIKDSGIDLERINRNRAGVILATGIGGLQTMEDEFEAFMANNKIPRFNPFFVPKMISNIAAGQVSIKYGLHGISYAVSSACASSNNALGSALDLIRLGRADMLIAGGSEATITRSSIGGFNAMRALSTRNDAPEKASRPFDKNRDGFVSGEGAGVLMVEELEHARRRGAHIYCELIGYGAASDAFHVAATHPEGLGAILAMETALEDAGLNPADVSYINAHATSTPVGDLSECKAIEKVFGDLLDQINVSATKSMTGHLLGAAGAIEAVACIKAIEKGMIPPTINLEEPDPAINPRLNLTALKAQQRNVSVALNNTFGFGGHSTTTVFRKFEA
jgi:3-oxoacyl-[acyl-carrier-protein] synthase II